VQHPTITIEGEKGEKKGERSLATRSLGHSSSRTKRTPPACLLRYTSTTVGGSSSGQADDQPTRGWIHPLDQPMMIGFF
jgi:hypothetical protein